MFSGTVIPGDGIGRAQGYGTANLDRHPEDIALDAGVYAAWATVLGKTYPAALVIQSDIPKVEVHLLDYAGGDLYGATIAVDPGEKVSEIERLDGEELKKKIIRDIALVREKIAS